MYREKPGETSQWLSPWLSLDVQREIVTRLETELSRIDAMAENFKRLAVLANEEFKAVLSETFANVEGPKAKLGDVCEELSTRGHQIKQSEIQPIGRFPVISQSENPIDDLNNNVQDGDA